MNQEERDWLEWLKRARDGVVTQRQAGEKMEVSDRWVRRLLRRMKSEGDGVVVHGLRGRGARHRTAQTAGVARLRANVCERAVGQAAQHPGQQGDGARMDDGPKGSGRRCRAN
jgi:HTH domain